MPSAALFLLLALGLLPVLPSFRRGLVNLAERVDSSGPAQRLKRMPVVALVLSVAVAALVLWSFRQATHFLGDGNLWIKSIETASEARSWDLAIPFSIYKTVSRFIGNLGGVDARTSAGAISAVSGLIFLVYAWKTSRQLSKERVERFFILLALLSTGSVMLFFGYIEAYPPAAAMMMVYLYFASRSLEGRGGTGAAALACLAAIVLHPSMIALLPSLFVLVISNRGASPATGKYFKAVSTTVIMGLAALWTLQRWRLFGGFFSESFLPILGGSTGNRIPYPIISLGNLVDIFNELLLVCPIAILLLVLLSSRGENPDDADRRRMIFFGTASIYFMLLFAVGNKVLGVSRDWDVFAPMAFPLALLTALLLLSRFRRNARDLAVFASFILLLHTVPWITINASTELSLRRFADLAGNPRWSSFARGYAFDVLGTYYFYSDDMPRALDYSIASVEADQGNVRYLYNAATRYMLANRHEEAIRMFEQVIRKKADYLDARLNLGTIYANLERYREAREQFLHALRIDPGSAPAHSKLAHACWREGEEGRASELYSKAIELDPANPENYMNLALLELNAGRRDDARRLMESAIGTEPEFAPAYLHLGRVCAQEGDMDRALELYGRHLHLEPAALDARFEMAVILDRSGRLDEALKHLLHVNEARPGDIKVMNNIGVIYSKCNEFDQAVRIFENALRVDQNQPDILVNAARAYVRTGDYPRAWACVIRAERLGAAPPARLLSELNSAMLRPGSE